MSSTRYTDESKIEAVRQIVEYGRPVAEVAERLGVSIHSLYGWKRQQGKGEVGRRVEQDQSVEVRRLKAELRRVTEERDILKKAAAYFANPIAHGLRTSRTSALMTASCIWRWCSICSHAKSLVGRPGKRSTPTWFCRLC
jgi:transposase